LNKISRLRIRKVIWNWYPIYIHLGIRCSLCRG